ncbi:MAG: cation diffusion facilitator family transporter [Phocaeicola sp.]|nr:cation diffusion facilitator family transporter [Phocaeicola sp.]
MNDETLKFNVQKRIVIVSGLILVGKFIAYFMTNSVGVLTDAMESIVNVVAGLISLFCLRWGSKPNDKEHPFGHGKIELISASVEGILISIAGLMIIYEGMERLIIPAEVRKLDIGIYIVAVSGLLNYFMGWYSIRVGKKYKSMALVAGGKHLQSDTYSTIGLVAGLVVLYFTGLAWIDSALALVFGSIIIATGVSILKNTIADLLDTADEKLLEDLAEILNNNRQKEWVDIHNTRIIKSGSYIFIDCDLTVPWYYTVEEGHLLGMHLKNVLLEKYSDKVQLTLHLDPCNIMEKPKCDTCMLDTCRHRRLPFVKPEKITLSNFTMSEDEMKVKYD